VKRSRAAWLAVATLLMLVVLLVLLLPARWAVPFVQARLHGLELEGVHGLVWNGGAGQLRGLDGRSLGQVHWRHRIAPACPGSPGWQGWRRSSTYRHRQRQPRRPHRL